MVFNSDLLFLLTYALAFDIILNKKGITQMKLVDTHSKCQVQIVHIDT